MSLRQYGNRRAGAANSTGAGSLGGQSNLATRGAERVTSGRTLAAPVVGLARHLERPVGIGLSSSGFDGVSSLEARQAGKPGGAGDHAQSHVYPTQYETVSGNQQSRQLSGHPGPLHMQLAEAQELLSLGSGVGLGEGTLNSGQAGAGGVFGPPLPGPTPPRGIMTAGGSAGGARPTYLAGGSQNRASHLPVGAKRLQTSQGPRGARGSNSLAKSAVRSSLPGARGGKGSKGQITPTASGGRQHYSSQNPGGSLPAAGMNIQGKAAAPGGQPPGRFAKQGSYGSVGHNRPTNDQGQSSVQPMNFNINFNTTNINVPQNGFQH